METEIRLDITPLFFPEHTRRAEDSPIGLDDINRAIEKQFKTDYPQVSLNDYDVKVEMYGKCDARAWIISTECSKKLLFDVALKAAKELYPSLDPNLDYNVVSSEMAIEEEFVIRV